MCVALCCTWVCQRVSRRRSLVLLRNVGEGMEAGGPYLEVCFAQPALLAVLGFGIKHHGAALSLQARDRAAGEETCDDSTG